MAQIRIINFEVDIFILSRLPLLLLHDNTNTVRNSSSLKLSGYVVRY